MPLYQIQDGRVRQLKVGKFRLERDLQQLCEANLLQLFGVQFIASEFLTGGRQAGRIDTLGLDQDGSPTIIEYKRSQKDNVINQGLFYLDWLVDHKGDFVVAAQEKLGEAIASKISWDHPRLILVAEEFTDYDKYAVNRIGANIELWTYRLYEEKFLLLEPIHATRSQKPSVAPDETIYGETETVIPKQQAKARYDLDYHLKGKPQLVVDLFWTLRDYILALGSSDAEIVETVNKLYISYRHGKNFVEVQVQTKQIKLFLDIPYSELDDLRHLARDVSNVGHWGTGEVQVTLQSKDDLEYVLGLIEQAYLYSI
jgi:predicted transport protein